MSLKLSERVRTAELLISLSDEISSEIRFCSYTVMEITEHIYNNSNYKKLDFIAEIIEMSQTRYDMHEMWREAVIKSDILHGDEKDIMVSMGNILGTSDTDGQISAIELHKKRLERVLENAVREYEQKGRMYRSMGVLAGAMAGIMLF